MRKIVFDIETQNFFDDVGKRDPTLLDIALLSIHDSETDSYTTFLHDKLDDLWPILEGADMLIGFNSEHFDLPLLNKYYHGDLSHIKHLDLMKEIQNALGRRIGLDAVAQATLGVGKSAHGAQGIRWWREGKIKELTEYCEQDVKVTKDLYEYMLENKCCHYFDLEGNKIEIKIDTSEWDKKETNGMTMSLGF